MAKRIEGNEIINDQWAEKAVKQGEDLLKVLEALEKQGKETAAELAKITRTQKGTTAKSISEISQAVSKSNIEREKALAISKEREKLEKKLIILRSNKIQQNEQLKVLNSEQRKINKQLAREELGLVDAYERESKTLIKLRKELKSLILTEGEGSKKTRELQKEVLALDKRLKGVDAAAGQFQRNVGNYPKVLGGAISSIKKFAGALGVVGGLQLLNRGLRDTFNIIKDFDQSQADLASVLGVNTEDMAELTAQAKELGATTKFTASEVAALQIEFAKLGFTQKEIQGVTEATLQLAAASGTDLANASQITGSTLRAFGMDVSETQRLVDVMAKSFSSSSLDIDKFSTAMAAVAPVAANAGVDIETTTALLGTLTDAGIDASTAGTGLRNVFLELSKRGMTFEEAMNEINTATDKNAKSLELFGKRGAVIGTVLAQNGVSVDALTEKLYNAGGAAEEMADKQLDTLQGSLDLLRSAWEGYILGADGASGASETLKNIVKFLAENLDTILNTLIKFAGAWGVYKTAVKAATIANNAFGKSVVKNVKGFGLWAAAIGLVVNALIEMVDDIMNAKDANDLFNDTMAKANEQLDAEKDKLRIVYDELKNTTVASEERQAVLDKINAEYGTTLQNLEDEAEFANQLAIAYDNVVEQLDRKIKLQVIEQDLLAETKKLRDLERAQEEAGEITFFDVVTGSYVGEGNLQGQIDTSRQLIDRFRKELIDLQAESTEINETITDQAEENTRSLSGGSRSTGGGKDKKPTPEQLLEEFKKQKALELKEYRLFLEQKYDDEEYIEMQLSERKKQIAFETRDKITELQLEGTDAYFDNELALNQLIKDNALERIDVEVSAIERVIDSENELRAVREENAKMTLEDIKKVSQTTVDALNEVAKVRGEKLDREIEASEDQIAKSESEVERLQEIGTAQAIQSAEAEKRRIDKENANIEALEKKKRNLLVITTGLERVNQLIQQGDSNPFATAGNELSNFTAALPVFYEGTDTTVADALGRTGTKDGHTVRVHDNEHIVSAKDSDRLHSNGIYKTSDIVDSAISWKNLNRQALRRGTDGNNSALLTEVQEMKKAFKSIKFPEQYVYLDRDIIKTGANTKTIDHRKNRI